MIVAAAIVAFWLAFIAFALRWLNRLYGNPSKGKR